MRYIVAALVGAGIMALVVYRDRLSLRWYEWLLGVLGLVLLLFALQNFSASLAEHEPIAPWRFLLFFGTPAIVLLVLSWFLPWQRHHKVKGESTHE